MTVDDRIEWQNRFAMNGNFEWVLKGEQEGEGR